MTALLDETETKIAARLFAKLGAIDTIVSIVEREADKSRTWRLGSLHHSDSEKPTFTVYERGEDFDDLVLHPNEVLEMFQFLRDDTIAKLQALDIVLKEESK